jgi:uncharacterized protein (TIGR03086 family)
MTQPAPAAWPAEGARLLEPSISYALDAVVAVTPELPSRRTPCRDWDLRMLLRHASESLAAIAEGIETGRVDLDLAAEDGDLAADPARAFRDRAGQLLDAWTSPGHQGQVIEIAGCPLAASVMAGAAALEVAVHGWDISRACGQRQPIPPRPGHRPAGDSPAARPPRRPAPPVRCTGHCASNGWPQRPARCLPRTRSPALLSWPRLRDDARSPGRAASRLCMRQGRRGSPRSRAAGCGRSRCDSHEPAWSSALAGGRSSTPRR